MRTRSSRRADEINRKRSSQALNMSFEFFTSLDRSLRPTRRPIASVRRSGHPGRGSYTRDDLRIPPAALPRAPRRAPIPAFDSSVRRRADARGAFTPAGRHCPAPPSRPRADRTGGFPSEITRREERSRVSRTTSWGSANPVAGRPTAAGRDPPARKTRPNSSTSAPRLRRTSRGPADRSTTRCARRPRRARAPRPAFRHLHRLALPPPPRRPGSLPLTHPSPPFLSPSPP